MIPCFSSSVNSFLAASSLSLSNRWYLAVTGQPSVTRKCCSQCVGFGSALDLCSTLGNSFSMCCRLGLLLGVSTVGSEGEESASNMGSEAEVGASSVGSEGEG